MFVLHVPVNACVCVCLCMCVCVCVWVHGHCMLVMFVHARAHDGMYVSMCHVTSVQWCMYVYMSCLHVCMCAHRTPSTRQPLWCTDV